MSPEIGDPVEHRVGTVAKWGPECYILDMIKKQCPDRRINCTRAKYP